MRLGGLMKSYIHDMVSRLLELHALEERLATLKKSRENTGDVKALIESLRGNMPVSLLSDHDHLRARGKRSVAEVRHGVCSGCHIRLAIGNVHELKTVSLRRCGNCGRYLYVVEDENEPAPVPAPVKPHRNAREKSVATDGAR
jgi:predicted  nucleic acid-binding Zn-ribbon protein